MEKYVKTTSISVLDENPNEPVTAWSSAVCVATHEGACYQTLRALVSAKSKEETVKKSENEAKKVMHWDKAEAKTIDVLKQMLISYTQSGIHINNLYIPIGSSCDAQKALSYQMSMSKEAHEKLTLMPSTQFASAHSLNMWTASIFYSAYVICTLDISVKQLKQTNSFSFNTATILKFIQARYTGIFTDASLEYFVTGDVPHFTDETFKSCTFKMHIVILARQMKSTNVAVTDKFYAKYKERTQLTDVLSRAFRLFESSKIETDVFDNGAWEVQSGKDETCQLQIRHFIETSEGLNGEKVVSCNTINTEGAEAKQALFVSKETLNLTIEGTKQESNNFGLAVAVETSKEPLIAYIGTSKNALNTIIKWFETKGKKAIFISCTLHVR